MQKQLYVVSESLHGHRKEWLTTVMSELSTNAVVLTIDEESILKSYGIKSIQFNSFRDLKDFIKEKRINSSFFFLEIDKWPLFLLCNRLENAGIVMRPYIVDNKTTSLMRWMIKNSCLLFARILKRSTVRFLSIPFQEKKIDYFRRNWVADDLQLKRIKTLNIDRIQQPIEAYSCGVFGFISDRKNIDICSEAFQVANSKSQMKSKMLIAGEWDSNLYSEFSKSGNENIVIINEYLNYAELIMKMQKTKVVLALYSNLGSSGIVTEALYLNKKIIIPNRKEFYPLRNKFPRNIFLADLNSESIAKTILVAEASRKESTRKLRQQLEAHFASGISSFLSKWLSS